MTNEQETVIKAVLRAERIKAEANEVRDVGRFADGQNPRGYKPLWFITFIHDRLGKFAFLKAQEYGDARREAFHRFGSNWGFMYPISDLDDQVECYGITELACHGCGMVGEHADGCPEDNRVPEEHR